MADSDPTAVIMEAIQALRNDLAAQIGRIDQRVRELEPPTNEEENEEPADEEDNQTVDNRRRRRNQDQNPPHNDRPHQEVNRNYSRDLKLTVPTFAGRVNPEAYLDWERRMEHIFEYYEYNDQKRIALASAQLTDHALSWWDREVQDRRRNNFDQITTWAAMKYNFRKRFVPPHYHREMQRQFRQLAQKNKSVEEYFEEFEQLKNRMALDEDEEVLMGHFIDGLNERISRKVERQPCHNLNELLHVAVQAEQGIKRKTAAASRSRPSQWNVPQSKNQWSTPQARSVDKGKAIASDSKEKKPAYEAPKNTRQEPGKSSNSNSITRARDITCFKCQGKGHYARDCPNQRVMIITQDGGYESQDEEEVLEAADSEEEIAYPETGEMLVVCRALSAMSDPDTIQRENLFFTRCLVQNKVCSLIIDGDFSPASRIRPSREISP